MNEKNTLENENPIQEPLYLYKFFPLPKELEKYIRDNESAAGTFRRLRKKSKRKENFKLKPILEKLQHLHNLLGEEKLYMAGVNEFNDPAEGVSLLSKAHIQNIIEHAKKPLNKEELLEIKKNMENNVGEYCPFSVVQWMKHYGISCFCGNFSEMPMWAYYANNHQGLCVRFKVNLPTAEILHFQSPYNVYQISEGITERKKYPTIVTLAKVAYEKNLEKFESDDFINTPSVMKQRKPTLTDLDKKIMRVFNTKATGWAHEEEYRLMITGYGKLFPLADFSNAQPNNKPLLEIDQIIFGLKMPPNVKAFLKKNYHSTKNGSAINFKEADIDFHNLKIITK